MCKSRQLLYKILLETLLILLTVSKKLLIFPFKELLLRLLLLVDFLLATLLSHPYDLSTLQDKKKEISQFFLPDYMH